MFIGRSTFLIGVLVIVIAACGRLAPADLPPQLEYTPGPFVIVTDQTYDAGVFTVRYPLGWQVITPATFNTPWVVFQSPDETAVIVLALDVDDTQVTPENIEQAELQRETTQIVLDEDTVFVVLVAPRAEWGDNLALFETVSNSVQPNTDS